MRIFLREKFLFLEFDQGTQHQTGLSCLVRCTRLTVKVSFDLLFQRFDDLNSQFFTGHDQRSSTLRMDMA